MQESVYAGGIGAEQLLGLGVDLPQVGFGNAPDADGAQEPIAIERGRPQDLGEPPRGNSAIHLELPQAVLRVHETERKLRISLGARKDVRNAVRVAQYFDRPIEPRDLQLALCLRQRKAQVKVTARDETAEDQNGGQ